MFKIVVHGVEIKPFVGPVNTPTDISLIHFFWYEKIDTKTVVDGLVETSAFVIFPGGCCAVLKL